MESKKSRPNSGSPGYIKGLPLKTADLVIPSDVTQPTYMEEPVKGFPLLGADNDGRCYSVQDSISNVKNKQLSDFLLDDFSDTRYFEDPVLSFSDSLLTGCHVDLNFEELRDFCLNNKFQNFVMF